VRELARRIGRQRQWCFRGCLGLVRWLSAQIRPPYSSSSSVDRHIGVHEQWRTQSLLSGTDREIVPERLSFENVIQSVTKICWFRRITGPSTRKNRIDPGAYFALGRNSGSAQF
jgi:hypothetical protein